MTRFVSFSCKKKLAHGLVIIFRQPILDRVSRASLSILIHHQSRPRDANCRTNFFSWRTSSCFS